MKRVLHVGSGGVHIINTHGFNQDEWEEVRLDINPAMGPDIVASMTDMQGVPDKSFECVFSSHNLEHLYSHEVPKALAEFKRVLKDDGFAIIVVPDIQDVAKMVAEGKLLETAYNSSAGQITPLDIMYGHRPSLEKGNLYMAHHTAFTYETLVEELKQIGFNNVKAYCKNFTLSAIATKTEDLSSFAQHVLWSFFEGVIKDA